jgi:hypothetical protein
MEDKEIRAAMNCHCSARFEREVTAPEKAEFRITESSKGCYHKTNDIIIKSTVS